MVEKNGLHKIREELLEMVQEEKRAEAEKILNRIIGEPEQEEITIHPNMFVGMLPEDIQDEIRKEVTSYLKKMGAYSEENVQNAMDSRLWVLDDAIDYHKYVTNQKEKQNARR